jgi:hypothetical protein
MAITPGEGCQEHEHRPAPLPVDEETIRVARHVAGTRTDSEWLAVEPLVRAPAPIPAVSGHPVAGSEAGSSGVIRCARTYSPPREYAKRTKAAGLNLIGDVALIIEIKSVALTLPGC